MIKIQVCRLGTKLDKRIIKLKNFTINKRQNFENMFYDKHFLHAIDELCRMRIKSLIKVLLYILICSGIIITTAMYYYKGKIIFEWMGIITIPLIVLSSKQVVSTNLYYVLKTKEKLLPMILRNIGDIKWLIGNDKMKDLKAVEYLQGILDANESAEGHDYLEKWSNRFHNRCIPDSDLKRSGLFSYYNKRTDDDIFLGKHKGVNFIISECTFQRQTISGKYRRSYTIFKGVIITFDIKKAIIHPTMITDRKDNDIGRKKGNHTYGAEITLEDPVFSKRFRVYSSDQIEARYLVTTRFMENFLNLKTAFGNRLAKCAFFDNQIMFAISTNQNLFEVGSLLNPPTNYRQIRKCYEQINSILKMIEYFKFDQNTGL